MYPLSIGNSSGVFGCHSFFEEIERAGRYEQTYLSNVVNKYFGCNLKELLNTYRVEYAKELLRSNKCSLDKVPEKSGFTSRSAFYSAFSKIAGESPKRYFLHEQRDLCAQSITNMYNQF